MLLPLADQDATPLIVTLAASSGIAQSGPYAFRFFSDERQQARAHIPAIVSAGHRRVAILYLNDEAGVSLAREFKDAATENGIGIVAEESFEPESADYRTQVLRMTSQEPDAIVLAVSTPAELLNALTQLRQSGTSAELFEMTLLLSLEPLHSNPVAEGVNGLAFPFTLNQTGAAFRRDYREAYGTDPMFAAAFGYDIISMIEEIPPGKNPSHALGTPRMLQTLNGEVRVLENGEINPPIRSVKVVNGTLVPN